MPFPSLRQLPLLGATYADLFRHAKIEETVYQVLTQQYEMAKVQEAKEVPTVKVLDHGEVPARKWGPHRAILAAVGGILGLLIGCLIVIGNDRWRNWDSNEPRKVFISETYDHLASRPFVQRIRSIFRRKMKTSGPVPDPWHDSGAH